MSINKVKYRIALLLLIPFITGATEFTDYTTLLNQKMETERRLEGHIGGIVSRIVGENRSNVIISVQTTDLSRSRVMTEQWLESETEREAAPPREAEILPGIPARTSIDTPQEATPEERTGGKQVEDIVTLPSEFINGIRVNLILERSIPEEVIATAEGIVTDVVNNINPGPGNVIETRLVDFAGKTIDFVGFLFNPYFYVIALVLITLAILAAFLFGPLRKFLFTALQTLKDLKSMKSEKEFTGGGMGGGISAPGLDDGELEIEEEESPDEEEGEEESPEDEEEREGELAAEGGPAEGEILTEEDEEYYKMTYQPLKFLEDKDLKKLAYLLAFEKPDVAALLIDYLDPAKGAKVMAALPRDKFIQVARSVVKMQRTSKEIMQHIDDFLAKKIDYVSGGADQLVSMLEVMNEEERQNLLDTLSSDDPQFAEKVRSRIFSFDNIITLDDAAIQLIIQDFDTKDLGIALKTVPEEIRDKFTNNMSEGAAALLKEEIEFGRNITDAQMKEKQLMIVTKIKELERGGVISGVTGAGSEELWEEELGEENKEGVLENIIDAAHEALKKKEELEVAEAAAGISSAASGADDELAFEEYEKGLEAYKNEEYEEAVKHFNKSVRYNPSVWQTYQYLGTCYLSLNDEASAREAYSRALELNPSNTELRAWLEAH